MRLLARTAVEIREQPQVLAAGQIRIEPRSLDEPGNTVERTGAVDDRVAAEEPRGSFGGTDQTEKHAQ